MSEAFEVGDVVESRPAGNQVTIVGVNGPIDVVCKECGNLVVGKISYDIEWPGGSVWRDMDLVDGVLVTRTKELVSEL